MGSIPEARTVADQTAAGDTHTAFIKTVTDAIDTSVATRGSSATISISGKSAADVMNTLSDLKRKGYRVAQSGTNWTVSW
jgi:hypothetical protein